jgi:phage terminase large subunit-like protein
MTTTTPPIADFADDDEPRRLTAAEIKAMAEQWSPEGRAQAANMVEDLVKGRRRAWYCANPGRDCDGKPHTGYPYPHARGDQWPPAGSDWFSWFLSGGRGSGKTRTGAEYTRRMSERVGRMALIAPTGADVRDTMIEGESGLIYVCAVAGQGVKWEPSKRRITFDNGCIATTFSAEEPDRLRGPNHGFAWLDEPAHYPNAEEVWSNLMFGLRIGARPHVVLTSTPLPTKWVREIQGRHNTRVVRVSTYANLDNLAPNFREEVVSQYEGTRKGRQELYGELLLDVEGSLWREEYLQHMGATNEPGPMDRIVVAIDPAGSQNKRSDETGIVAVGREGKFGHVLRDASGKYSPQGWARMALSVYRDLEADAIVAERNFGGDMVKKVIETEAEAMGLNPRIIVKTAMRSKALRAEPIVNLYEQSRVFHWNDLAELENEMLTWIPGTGPSPNRVDALVWALDELISTSSIGRIRSARGGTMRRRDDDDPRWGRRSA